MTPQPVLRAEIDLETPGSAAALEAVDRVLTDFHRAAADADEERYFGHFAPEGVFLGTDGTERWTVEQFRKWAAPYFARESAWTFVPRDRNIYLAGGDTVAWFDEVAVSEAYGAYRGTGVLRRIDGVWRISQYNLTIPVPNDLAKNLVTRIRAYESGGAPTGTSEPADAGVTTIVLVRHAEKADEPGNPDPGLTDEGRARAKRLAHMLSAMGVDAVYATQFRRTRGTVEPTAKQVGCEVSIVDARAVEELAERLRTAHAGETVLVAGHSNTVPAMLRALGVRSAEGLAIDEADYGNLFVVTVGQGRFGSHLAMRF